MFEHLLSPMHRLTLVLVFGQLVSYEPKVARKTAKRNQREPVFTL